MAMQAQDVCGVRIGWAQRDITPGRSNALEGQFYARVSEGIDNPIGVTAMAVESEEPQGAQAIIVSCDLVGIRVSILERVRESLAGRIADFDPRMLILNVTHTHTAPALEEGFYPPQATGVMTPSEYADFFVARAAAAAAEAWKNRKPSGISRAFSQAVVGHNRRAVYLDGSARMYGKTDDGLFAGIEGYEDHGLNLLFTWDAERRLTGIIVNIACPSQVDEHLKIISADYWHETRIELRRRYGEGIFILPQCCPAGDQSPHLLLFDKLEASMRERRGLSERQEIARRIANAVDDVFDLAKSAVQTQPVLRHVAETLDLPARLVTDEEYENAKAEYAKLEADGEMEASWRFVHMRRSRAVIERYERQREAADGSPVHPVELHVLRIGDVAMATNPFELFLDFGLRIKARSKALQCFLIQLACAYDGYLPTERAVRGGSYGAEVASNQVGPDGGQVLVERTVELINAMWDYSILR